MNIALAKDLYTVRFKKLCLDDFYRFKMYLHAQIEKWKLKVPCDVSFMSVLRKCARKQFSTKVEKFEISRDISIFHNYL